MQTREEFLKARKSGIGGSDIGAIAGLSKWRTAYDVWADKTSNDVNDEMNDAMYWGTVLEDVVAKEYATRSGNKVQRVNQILRHPEFPFCVANIDRAVINPDIAGAVRWNGKRLSTDKILECKTANGFNTQDWGEPGTDSVPDTYYVQCQWYLFITGAKTCDLAVLIGGQDYRRYTIERNETVINGLLNIAKDFWKHVEAGTPPSTLSAKDIIKMFPESQAGKFKDVGQEALDAVKKIKALSADIKVLEETKSELEAYIKSQFEDAEELRVDGKKVATWKSQSRTTFDSKKFKEDHPAEYESYTKVASNRVLRLSNV